MNRTKLFTVIFAGSLLAACDSGDINITPTTIDNSVDNSTGGGGGNNPDDSICAAYILNGVEVRGSADADGNCNYGLAFSGPTNNLVTDLVIPALPNDGKHIFTSSLFVGETYNTQADLAAAGITQGGDGPTLTVEAGATLAFATNSDFMIINRGSRIVANGRADAPITFTSVSDIDGTVQPEDVQQWGGIVINGFGVTNACFYDGIRGEAGFGLTPGTECSVEAEGSAGDDASQYGGDNDADNSGVLRYVVTKHTGAEVQNGDELNGISFGGVGSGTVVENLQVYSTFDDGIEMFGGSVNFTNFVAVYARDDSIDIDNGYNGTITNALVIQQGADGNHCIESDGLGGYSGLDQPTIDDYIARGLNSRPVINGLTCIITGNETGTHDPGAGWRFREAIFPTVNNSIVVTYAANSTTNPNDNYGIRIDDPETNAAVGTGDLALNGVVVAVQEPQRDTEQGDLEAAAGSEIQFSADAIAADGAAIDPTVASGTITLLEGDNGIYSVAFGSASVDGAAPTVTPVEVDGETPAFIGGVDSSNDWTAGWTYGIEEDNRGQPLPWQQ